MDHKRWEWREAEKKEIRSYQNPLKKGSSLKERVVRIDIHKDENDKK